MQLVDKYKPTTIEAFAGVERPKKILMAFAKKPYTSAWLLIGPSGIGKTTMAFAVAEAIGATAQVGGGIYHIPARKCDLEAIDTIAGECRHRPMLGGTWNVVVIDEADQMTAAAQLALLSKLDSTDPPPDTIWFLTANAVDKLDEHERFLSRCRKIQFTTDGLLQPGAALLKRIWRAETKGSKEKPPQPDFELIMRTAKFNVREALMLLETEILCPGSVCEEATPSRGISIVGKGNGAGTIYTIGMEGYTPAAMVEAAKALGIHNFIDCCWKPKRPFRNALGDIYQWGGDRISNGRINATQREDGLKWLLGLVASGKNVMLMFPHEHPTDNCNRHFGLAMTLLKRGVDVTHVFEDQLILASELQASIDEDRDYEFTKWCLPKVVGE